MGEIERMSVRSRNICVIKSKQIYIELNKYTNILIKQSKSTLIKQIGKVWHWISSVYICLIFLTIHKAEIIVLTQQGAKRGSEKIISCLVWLGIPILQFLGNGPVSCIRLCHHRTTTVANSVSDHVPIGLYCMWKTSRQPLGFGLSV